MARPCCGFPFTVVKSPPSHKLVPSVAIARGRVRTLLVTDSGFGDDRVAWYGERSAELSGHRVELERLGAHPRRGRLVDAAVRAAILTDADIRVLRPGTAGAPAQGLGALCRFR